MSTRILVVLLVLAAAVQTHAAPYLVPYYDGGTWSTIYAQGFSTSLGATPPPALSNGTPVYLSQFKFYKSGNADSASNIRVAILNNIFADLTNLSTSHGAFVGLSSNTVPTTSGMAVWDPITFSFNNLQLTYGNEYAAVFVNENAGQLTPVLVSALTANYIDAGGGDFHPQTNYGTESQFQYATSNFITTNAFGSFFNTFSYAGDANFEATLDVPEPGCAGLLAAAAMIAIRRKRVP